MITKVNYVNIELFSKYKPDSFNFIFTICLLKLDTDGLRKQALEGFQMGFTGKQIIHPGQVEICQESFTPSPEKIEWARELIQSFAEHQDSGKVC